MTEIQTIQISYVAGLLIQVLFWSFCHLNFEFVCGVRLENIPDFDIRISNLYETKPSGLKPKPGPPGQDALYGTRRLS